MKSLEVIALTLLAGKSAVPSGFSVFPFLFFLIAVPWPTLVEAPIVNHLRRTIAIGTTEIIGWLGIPALLQGNVIETGCGMVGIEEACSGIRSFQASLMIALFFGHWYRLGLARRAICMMTALMLAIVLNLARTTLLVAIAATNGIAQTARWHESVGTLLPLICFLSAGLVAMLLEKHSLDPLRTASLPQQVGLVERFRALLAGFEQQVVFPALLLVWIGLTEISTRIWYSFRESTLPAPISWHIEPPTNQSQLCQLPVSDIARQILRFSEALNINWTDKSRFKWQAIFLRWKPGVTAAFLARNHTPADCLSAAGHQLLGQSELRVPVCGLDLPFRCYVTQTEQGIVRVFYCLWEDRAKRRSFDAGWLTYRERVSAVLAGQRNSGQRSLEIAVWGARTQQEADAALQPVLEQILRVDR